MTSNEGFSVVAPIRVTVPSSTAGSRASCWALLNRWISSMNRTVRLPRRRSAFASAMASRSSLTPERTADSGANRAPAGAGEQAGQRGLARPGSAPEDQRRERPAPLDQLPDEPPRADEVGLADEFVQVRGRIRSASGASAAGAAGSSSGSPAPKRLRVSCRGMRQTSRGHGGVGLDCNRRRLVPRRSPRLFPQHSSLQPGPDPIQSLPRIRLGSFVATARGRNTDETGRTSVRDRPGCWLCWAPSPGRWRWRHHPRS